MASFTCDLSGLATPGRQTIPACGPDPYTEFSAEPAFSDRPDAVQPHARSRDRVGVAVAVRGQDGPADDHAVGLRRRLASALAETTPTLLPELLRSFSQQAGHLAHHPFNAFDNNPFITREWLIVSLVLDAAASTMEKRFETLFLSSAA